MPGYEAPVHISWAHRNRTALIRVPLYIQGKESTVRAELRNPDPAANPYLAFAVMLAAGLDGIEQGYELPPSVEPNIYKMSSEEREAIGLASLPNNLYEAVQETQKSELVRETLGEHVFDRFITNKLNEWYEYREQVSSLGDRQVPGHGLAVRDRPAAHAAGPQDRCRAARRAGRPRVGRRPARRGKEGAAAGRW